MAVRIEKAFGVKMDALMHMQSAFDIARARRKVARIKVRRYSAELSFGKRSRGKDDQPRGSSGRGNTLLHLQHAYDVGNAG